MTSTALRIPAVESAACCSAARLPAEMEFSTPASFRSSRTSATPSSAASRKACRAGTLCGARSSAAHRRSRAPMARAASRPGGRCERKIDDQRDAGRNGDKKPGVQQRPGRLLAHLNGAQQIERISYDQSQRAGHRPQLAGGREKQQREGNRRDAQNPQGRLIHDELRHEEHEADDD